MRRLAALLVLVCHAAVFAARMQCHGVDDTLAVQAALDRAPVVKLPPGVCVVGPLKVPSNRLIAFRHTTFLKAKPGYGEKERLLNIVDVIMYGDFDHQFSRGRMCGGKIRLLA